jgi:hypothetical protein
VDLEELIDHFPRLFHVTEAGAWPSILRHGLLSTSALLDLYGIDDASRVAIETEPRPGAVLLDDPTLGRAVVRDNRPLRVDILRRCLDGTVSDWCRALNTRVFFWATERRLENHLRARGHRDQPREVVVVDTARLLARDGAAVTLCAFNSGSALYPNAPRRGPGSFVAVDAYPFRELRARRGLRDAVVEVCVERALVDVPAVTESVWSIGAGGEREEIWGVSASAQRVAAR